jgi:hypothetical protein
LASTVEATKAPAFRVAAVASPQASAVALNASDLLATATVFSLLLLLELNMHLNWNSCSLAVNSTLYKGKVSLITHSFDLH